MTWVLDRMDQVSCRVVAADDGSLPGDQAAQQALLEEWTTYDLDHYYAHVAELTFAARFFPINTKHLLHILTRDELNADEERSRDELVQDLTDVLASEQMGGRGFVKLSTRSPKDAVDHLSSTLDLLRTEIAGLLNRVEAPTAQQLIIAQQQAFFNAMCVQSGEQAIELLAKSGRVVSDLVRWCALLPERSIRVVVRPFVMIPPWAEFRCFVYERQLTAATQYVSHLFFPDELVAHEQDLSRQLQIFAARVISKLPEKAFRSFILDAALWDSHEWLIELNPFGPLTGAGLFDWEKDSAQLHGKEPFTLRLRREPANVRLESRICDEILADLGAIGSIDEQFEKSARNVG